jgi:hypothetical protein
VTSRSSTPPRIRQPLPPPAPTEHILQFFAFAHLPPHLQEVSARHSSCFRRAVHHERCRAIPERTVALRKLLESKDAAVRAALAK